MIVEHSWVCPDHGVRHSFRTDTSNATEVVATEIAAKALDACVACTEPALRQPVGRTALARCNERVEHRREERTS